MDNIKKFEDFLDRMQGLLDNAKEQGHIIVRVEDLENAFPELKEEESKEKPNGGIVMENFDEGDGFYKVNLAYLNKKQVEEIEELARKWNQEVESADENIRKALVRFHKSSIDIDGIKGEDIIAWLEKQDKQKLTWSEEDEKMIDEIIDYMKPMPIFFESTKGKSGKEYTQKFVKNAINWLKSLKERIGE